MKAWPRFDSSRSSPRTWLLTIARNALIDERRRRKPEASIDEDSVDVDLRLSEPGPEDALEGIGPELQDALRRLQPREQEVLALRYGADLSTAEVAALMGLTVANVQQIASRALRKLRGELEGRAGYRRSGLAGPPLTPDGPDSADVQGG